MPQLTDHRILAVPIGCGECIECMQKKAREWKVRLKEEIKTNKIATFVTLTFSNEAITKLYNDKRINNLSGYQLDNAAATLAVRLFTERWRKEHKKTIRHWLITELGHNGTENIHIHGIIWSKNKEQIDKHWKYGWIYHGKYINEKTINYIAKYVTKQDLKHKAYKPKILTSNGIGNKYTETKQAEYNKYKEKETNETYRTNQGLKTALPIYYRNKIYTEEEREKLWIEKLNKNERYILGQKITNEQQYKKILKTAQEKNQRLGYGKGNTKWKLANYEAERRQLLQEKRKEMTTSKNIYKSNEALPQTPSYEPSPGGQGYNNQETNINGLLAYIKNNT